MSFRTYSFEKLEAWKVAKEFAIFIYRITENFPEEEKYELTRQLRKGAIGIPSHLAEGSGRITGKDKAHFTSMAFSTLMEIINQIIISYEFGYLSEKDYIESRKRADRLGYLLHQLRQSQLDQNK